MWDILFNPKLWITWCGLMLVTTLGDEYVEKFVSGLPPKSLLRAADTVVHGLIGGFSFWLTCILAPKLVIEVAGLCQLSAGRCKTLRAVLSINILFNFGVAFILSCSVDLDHVIGDLIQMIRKGPRVPWERGCLHYSLPPLLLAAVLYLSSVALRSLWCLRLATLILVCILSHHVRDGLHHGLWFQPFGTTPKLTHWLYLTITLTLPMITGAIDNLILLRFKSVQNTMDTFIV